MLIVLQLIKHFAFAPSTEIAHSLALADLVNQNHSCPPFCSCCSVVLRNDATAAWAALEVSLC